MKKVYRLVREIHIHGRIRLLLAAGQRSTAEAPLELLPRVGGMLDVLFRGVFVLCASSFCGLSVTAV